MFQMFLIIALHIYHVDIFLVSMYAIDYSIDYANVSAT